MKRVLALCLIFFLASCATTGDKSASNATQTKLNSSGYDEKYISRVEHQASQHGVIVRWVNPPVAPKRKKDG